MIVYFAATVVLLWLAFLAAMALEKTKQKKTSDVSHQTPLVSILIALRNEAQQVQTLCASLKQLNYPHFEILLGDDASTDETYSLLQRDKPDNAVLHTFSEHETGSFGKQKVLAEMAVHAQGEYLLFTDADMTFPPNWIQGMLKNAGKNRLTVGYTQVSGDDLFARMQNMDWLFHEHVIQWGANRGYSITAWGNNMMISRDTYDSIGGYQSLENSIIEDVALLRQVVRKGGCLNVNTDPEAVADTQPMGSIRSLLQQRKRWMKGMIGVSPLCWVGVVLKFIFLPAALYLIYTNSIGLVALALALGLKYFIFNKISKITKDHYSILRLLIYEIYDFVFYFITFVYSLLPTRIVWKGRKYR